MDPARFVFLDETGTATNMARRYGRSPLGAVAGLRQSGVVAPLVLDGPMTGPAFRAYVEQFLAPALTPGDVVVLDNLVAHKVAGIRQALAAVGTSLLYLHSWDDIRLTPPPRRLADRRRSACRS
jgi:hypothetical protein